MSKASKFRELLFSDKLEYTCEVHNALSASIAEEAGFKALWGSSLTISASLGVRDSNEASWTQILEVIEFITDATSVPVLLDGDTGYGNFNNMRRLVRKLEQRGVAAVCIEDKIFPKKNSFIQGNRQPLADIDEFCGKIKAAKDSQSDPDFSLIARVEAFIAGWGLGEAIKRAEAYHKAGADGILIHSKISRPDEVLQFKKEWGDRSPVIIVPTKYHTTPVEVFQNAGFSMIIWANMLLRSAVKSMTDIATRLKKDNSLLDIDDDIAPMSEVFRLQNADELETAEALYLPTRGQRTYAVILAASQGKDLGVLTQDKPKTLLEVTGKPILYKQIDTLNEIGIKNITVVRGYKKEKIDSPNLHFVDNDEHATTQEVYSLYKGIQGIEDYTTIISYGDILYKKYIPTSLLEMDSDFTVVVDADWQLSHNNDRYADYVICNAPYQKNIFEEKVTMVKSGNSLEKEKICGEWIGLLKLTDNGMQILKNILNELSANENFKNMRMSELFNEIIVRGHEINVLYIRGHWLDIDDIRDISSANAF